LCNRILALRWGGVGGGMSRYIRNLHWDGS
jgi:hypothetical protein